MLGGAAWEGGGTPLCVYDHREFDFLVLTQLQWFGHLESGTFGWL